MAMANGNGIKYFSLRRFFFLPWFAKRFATIGLEAKGFLRYG